MIEAHFGCKIRPIKTERKLTMKNKTIAVIIKIYLNTEWPKGQNILKNSLAKGEETSSFVIFFLN